MAPILGAVNTRIRRVAWVKEDPFGVEQAEVRLNPQTMSAVGVAIGTEPTPYRLDYRLVTRRGFVTARLLVDARGDGWRRRLRLRRDAAGVWGEETTVEGAALPPPTGGLESLEASSFDCDLGLSPLTNTMPVLRQGLLDGGGPVDFTMAWVSVPDLAVRPSLQRYTAIRVDGDRHIVRYEDEDGFMADIVFDPDGLVLDYPSLARRFG